MAPSDSDAVLSEVLTQNEINELASEVRIKLDIYFSDCNKKLLDTEANHEKQKINSEQLYFELEKEMLQHKGQLATQAQALQDANKRLAEIEHNYNEASSRLGAMQTQHANLQSEKSQLEINNQQIKNEKEELVNLLEKKSKEMQTLNDEWRTMSDKVMQLTNEKCEAVAKFEDVQSKEISLQYRETRYEQEKIHLQQQIDWLNSELSQKSNELFSLRKSQSTNLMELHHQLELKTDEASHLQEALEAQRKTSEQQLSHINSYIQKLKDVQSTHMQVEEQYRCELQAQQRLVQLYKVSSEESEEKVKELTTAVEELQRLLKQVTEDYKATLQAKENDSVHLEESMKLRDEQIRKMDAELKNCNDLLRKSGQLRVEDIEAMSPSAAAASKLLRSGMTLTQIYSEFVQSTDALALEREENKRLNLYLDQILQEIEEKAPILRRQREEYEHALETINNLTSQLENAMLESERERISADEASKKASSLVREEARLKRENQDLALQVQILLKELEQSCGNYVSSTVESAAEDRSLNEVSSSAHLITDKLVTFRNIEELQAQNQKLLQVVRELSEDREAAERACVDARTAELRQQLATAEHDIEELRCSRSRQAELVESIVRQRDMYRVLLSQMGVSPMPAVALPSPRKSDSSAQTATSPMVAQVNQSAIAVDQSSSTELKAAMKELQEEFVSYKQERQKNEKMLSEQVDKLRSEQSDMRMQNTKLCSQLEYSSERFKALQANADGYKRELEFLRSRNLKHSAAIVQHEHTINSLRQEAMAVQEQFARSEVHCQSLVQERDLLKTAESRLLLEMESLRREKSTHSVLLTNLLTIQNNLERTEFEMKTKYSNRMEAVERDNSALKKKLDVAEEHVRTATKSLETQLSGAREHLDKEVASHQKTREELMRAYADLTGLKQELSEQGLKLRTAEARLAGNGTSIPGQQRQDVRGVPGTTLAVDSLTSADIKSELDHARSEIEALKLQVDKSRQHADQYKAIAESIEQSLRDQNEASRQFKEAFERKLEESTNVNLENQKTIQSLEKERQDLLNENIKITEESHQLNADLRKQLASLQNDLESCAQRLENATASERLAKEDLSVQVRLAQEAQDKYERELLLHAGNVEKLNTVKRELENFNTRLVAAQDAAIMAEVTLESSQVSWLEREKLLTEENARQSARLQDFDKQNELLHQQLESLSAHMAALGQRDNSSLDVSFGEDSQRSKSSEQLVEVIRFLRREKEIAETKLEMSQAESSRSRQRLQLLEQQMEETTRSLATERERNEVISQTASQHAELLRKVEQLNLLSDSNRLLREEKERMAVQVQQAELKVQKLESQLDPLRQQSTQLEARVDALEGDKKVLQSEVERWKARTNQLIEQSHKADPEELKKAINERDEMKKKVTTYVEENQKNRVEITRLNNQLNAARNEGAALKQQMDRLLKENGEKDELKKKVSTYIEENQKHRAEISRLNNQLSTSRNELAAAKQMNDKLTAQVNAAKAAINAPSGNANVATPVQLLQPSAIAAGIAGTSRDVAPAETLAAAGGSAASSSGASQKLQPDESGKVLEQQQLLKKVQELNSEMEAKEKIVANLRKIGRKYKQQYEDLHKEYTIFKAANVSAASAANTSQLTLPSSSAAPAAGSITGQPLATSLESAAVAAAAAASIKELTTKLEQSEEEKQALQKRVAELEAKLNALTSELTRVAQENSVLRASEESLKAERTDTEAKQRHKQQVLQNAKNKLQSQRAEIERLQLHNQQLDDRLKHQQQQQQQDMDVAEAELRAQYEAECQRLETELQAAKRTVQEFEHQQSVVSMPVTSTVTVSTTAAVDHPTANIRPLTSPAPPPPSHTVHAVCVSSASVRHAAPMLQHAVTSASLTAAAAASSPAGGAGGRMTASIRPMAQSRTATVMPTTLAASASATPSTAAATGGSQPLEVASSSQPPATVEEPLLISMQTVRRLQQVQPVSPRLDDIASVSPSSSLPQTSMAAVSQQAEPDTSSRLQPPTDRSLSTSSTDAVAAGSKRTRTDEESPESSTREPEVKKPKTEMAVAASATAEAASATVEIQAEEDEEEATLGEEVESVAGVTAAADDGGHYMAADVPSEGRPATAEVTEVDIESEQIEPGVEENEAAALPAEEDAEPMLRAATSGRLTTSVVAAPSEEPSSELQEVFIEESDDGAAATHEMSQSDDVVVVVEEDVESAEGEDSPYEGSDHRGEAAQDEDAGSQYEGEEDYQGEEQENYEEESTREYEGEADEEEPMSAQHGGNSSSNESSDGERASGRGDDNGSGDDDVVIVDEAPSASPAAVSSQPASSHLNTHVVPSMASSQQHPRTGRNLTSAATRLPSFAATTFVTQTSVFGDNGEDGVVPSTPTLFVPKRTDAFAGAVSSPFRLSDNFVFASATDTQSDFGQLASQVYMDDIRDLSQFSETERPQSSSGGANAATSSQQEPRVSAVQSSQPRSAATGAQQVPVTQEDASADDGDHQSGGELATQAPATFSDDRAPAAQDAEGEERGDIDGSSGSSADRGVRSGVDAWEDASSHFPSSSLLASSGATGQQQRRGLARGSQQARGARGSRLNRPQFRSDQQ